VKGRGVNDILIAVVDGLKGFPEAVTSSIVQTCIVHLIRNSLAFVSWKARVGLLPAIKAIYRARTPTWHSRGAVPLTPRSRCTESQIHLHRNLLHKTSDTIETAPSSIPTNPPTGPVAHSSAHTVLA